MATMILFAPRPARKYLSAALASSSPRELLEAAEAPESLASLCNCRDRVEPTWQTFYHRRHRYPFRFFSRPIGFQASRLPTGTAKSRAKTNIKSQTQVRKA